MKRLTLLFDADDTILDFNRAETAAITLTLKHYDLLSYDGIVKAYKAINLQVWHEYEQRLITRDELAYVRFDRLFERYNITLLDSKAVSIYYRDCLAQMAHVIRGSIKFLEQIYIDNDLYIITNGIEKTQLLRFKKARLNKYFKKLYISEKMKLRKPDKEFFDYVKNDIPNYDSDNTYIIGDSLTSDILGGINSNIKTIWFNRRYLIKNNVKFKPDYIVGSYKELLSLIDDLKN